PAFVGTFGFEAAEGARLTSQGGAVQPAAVQMLTDGPLRQMDAMPGFQNRADLDCRASRQFQAELAGFLQEFGMATHDAEIGARWWTQPVEPMLAISADPAIEGHARVSPLTAIWMFVGLVRQLAHQVAAFG